MMTFEKKFVEKNVIAKTGKWYYEMSRRKGEMSYNSVEREREHSPCAEDSQRRQRENKRHSEADHQSNGRDKSRSAGTNKMNSRTSTKTRMRNLRLKFWREAY